MLANNNKKITFTLAKKSLRRNKGKFSIMIGTVILSAFMIFSVLTVGATYINMNSLQDLRLQGGDFDVTIGNGITKKQEQQCRQNKMIAAAGISAYAGYGIKTSADSTLHSGMVWSDDVHWNQITKPARTFTEGHYPKKNNELMVTKEVLADCGKENLSVGDSFVLTYGDKKGTHTQKFRICGIWDGYGAKNVFYVSKDFYIQSGYQLQYNGIMSIQYQHPFVSAKAQSELQDSLKLTDRQYYMPTLNATKMTGILTGIIGLAAITCFSAYLLLYNILYLSISRNIRYYGLLQTVGMTGKQVYGFLSKQMLYVGTIGITSGILLGATVSFLLIPAAVKALGIRNTAVTVSFSPVIFLTSIVLIGMTLFLCSRKPVKIAASVSPVAALGYRPLWSVKHTYKTGKAGVLWRMAAEQLKKDKKRTIVVLLSLTACLTVFLSVITLLESKNASAVMSNYMDTDLIIKNDTLQKENINQWSHLINNSFIQQIDSISDVKETQPLSCAKIIVPWEPGFSDMWMKSFYQIWKDDSYKKDKADYQKHPEKYYSLLKGIGEKELNHLAQNLDGPVNKNDFLQGKVCILYGSNLSLDMDQLKNKTVTFLLNSNDSHSYQLKIAALTDDEYYGGTTGGGPILIVSSAYLKQLINRPYIEKLNVIYEKEYDKNTELKIKNIIQKSPSANGFSWESKIEGMEEIEDAQGNMGGIGMGIVVVLAWIGIMNYINTVTVNIQSQSASLSIMESIGMTERQVRALLVREGLLYAAGSLLITATAGLIISYICYQSMNYGPVPFKVPLLPMVSAAGLISFMCAFIPPVAYRHMRKKGTIAERIRMES